MFGTSDINLSTLRGDGNVHVQSSYPSFRLGDINLSTSRGDGNQFQGNFDAITNSFDINLITSQGDFFENFENSIDTASRKC